MIKLDPARVLELNDAVRRRAGEIAKMYGMPERKQSVNRVLRDEFQKEFGCAVKDTDPDERERALSFIVNWDDPERIRNLRWR